jgi:hypothetical protein
MLRWAGHVVGMEELLNTYTILVGKPEGKKSFVKPTRKWKDIVKINLMGKRLNWIYLDLYKGEC